MANDEIFISGEKLRCLQEPVEKMAEFALRLGIGLRTLNYLIKPGSHRLRIDTLEKMAKSLGVSRAIMFDRIKADDATGDAEVVVDLAEIRTFKELKIKWDQSRGGKLSQRKAARKPGGAAQ